MCSTFNAATLADLPSNAQALTVKGIRITRTVNRIAIGDVDMTMARALHAAPLAGFYDIIVHSRAHGQAVALWRDGATVDIDACTLSELIRAQPDYAGQPIRIVSCWIGAVTDGIAQRLAETLQVIVAAATGRVYVHRCGRLQVIDGGVWRHFEPQDFPPIDPDEI